MTQVSSQSSVSSQAATRSRGLKNLGNTCFLNAVMQALMHVGAFQEYFVNRLPSLFPGTWTATAPCVKSPRAGGRNTRKTAEITLWVELHKLFQALKCGKLSVVSPHSMVSALWHLLPCFRGYTQQDAQEFLFFIFDRLDAELPHGAAEPSTKKRKNSSPTKTPNAIRQLFQGRLISQVLCQKCKVITNKEEPFLDVSLQIATQHHSVAGPRRSSRHAKPPAAAAIPSCSLEECLQSYVRAELLPGAYLCDTCQERTSAWKKLSFGATPEGCSNPRSPLSCSALHRPQAVCVQPIHPVVVQSGHSRGIPFDRTDPPPVDARRLHPRPQRGRFLLLLLLLLLLNPQCDPGE